MSIVVKIDQFNNNTRSASTGDNQRINNALLIPNEFNDLNKHNEMHLHKGKKMNYVCSINPTKLSNIYRNDYRFSREVKYFPKDYIMLKLPHYLKLYHSEFHLQVQVVSQA